MIGDSTTRELTYDAALWLSDCEADGGHAVCEQVDALRKIRNVNSTAFEILCDDHGKSLTLLFYRNEQVSNLARKPWYDGAVAHFAGDALVLNSGLWNLKHDRHLGSTQAILQNYYLEIHALLSSLKASPAAAALQRRLYWRSLLPIEYRSGLTQGAFTRDAVKQANAAVLPQWAAAGFNVIDVWQYGVHASRSIDGATGTDAGPVNTTGGSRLILTKDAVHFPYNVNVELAKALLGAIYEDLSAEDAHQPVVAAQGSSSSSGDGGGGRWDWVWWWQDAPSLPHSSASNNSDDSSGGGGRIPAWFGLSLAAVALMVARRYRSGSFRPRVSSEGPIGAASVHSDNSSNSDGGRTPLQWWVGRSMRRGQGHIARVRPITSTSATSTTVAGNSDHGSQPGRADGNDDDDDGVTERTSIIIITDGAGGTGGARAAPSPLRPEYGPGKRRKAAEAGS